LQKWEKCIAWLKISLKSLVTEAIPYILERLEINVGAVSHV